MILVQKHSIILAKAGISIILAERRWSETPACAGDR